MTARRILPGANLKPLRSSDPAADSWISTVLLPYVALVYQQLNNSAVLSDDNEFLGAIKRSGTPQTLTGAGAIDITSWATLLVTTGADALTLADGAEGQEKFIKMKTDGGDGTLTPTNLANGTTITFDDAGDTAHLMFLDGEWCMFGGTATLA